MQNASASNFPSRTEEISDDEYRISAWKSDVCMRCVHDYHCPDALMRCSDDNCCIENKCFDNLDCHQESNIKYYTVSGVNAYSSTINPLQPFDDPTDAAKECELNPECVAYNSLGFMKEWLPPASLWQVQPMVEGLPAWKLNLKKSVVDDKNDTRIDLPQGIRSFCKFEGEDIDKTPYGMCTTCIGCKTDADCPISDMCVDSCCVGNPCLTGDVYDDEWVNIRYDRDPQCNCPIDKPNCCLINNNDTSSFYCSEKPCWKTRMLPACAYICEDSFEKFNPIMCQANESCCNANKDSPPVCCDIRTPRLYSRRSDWCKCVYGRNVVFVRRRRHNLPNPLPCVVDMLQRHFYNSGYLL